MRSVALGLSAAGLAMATGPALAAKETASFTPTSQWVLDYAQEYCSLRRAFERDGKKLVLEFRQYNPGQRYDVVIMSEGKRFRGRQLNYRFSPHERVLKDDYAFGMESQNGHRGVFSSGNFGPRESSEESDDNDQRDVAEEALGQWAASVAKIEILRGFGKKFTIETAPWTPRYLLWTRVSTNSSHIGESIRTLPRQIFEEQRQRIRSSGPGNYKQPIPARH